MDIGENGLTEEESALAIKWSEGLIGDDELNTPNLRRALLSEEVDSDEKLEENLELDKQELDLTSESVDKSEAEKEASKSHVEKKEKVPIKQALFESKNELNTLKQKYDAQQKKLKDPAYLEQFIKDNNIDVGERFTPISKEDIYTDEKLVEIIDANNKTNERLSARELAEEALHKKEASETKMFSEIYAVQGEFDSLKTDMDIGEINNIFMKHGGHNVPKEKAIESGVSEGDFEKYVKIVETKNYMAKHGFRSMRVAYLENGGMDHIVKSKANLNLGEEINRRQKEALKSIPRVSGGFTNESEVESRGGVSESLINNIIAKEKRVTWDGLSKEEVAILEKHLDGVN